MNNIKINGNGWTKKKIISKIPSILVLIFMIVVVIEILILPIELNDYPLLFGVLTSLIISITSIYLIEKFNKPTISILGIIVSAIIFFMFMGSYGNAPTLLYVVFETFIIYIAILIKKMNKEK